MSSSGTNKNRHFCITTFTVVVMFVFSFLTLDLRYPLQKSMDNLNKCHEAAMLDVELTKVLIDGMKDKSSLIKTEDSLLTLSSSETVDCIFYYAMFDIVVGTSIIHLVQIYFHMLFIQRQMF